jgi:hypothetical protein
MDGPDAGIALVVVIGIYVGAFVILYSVMG